MDTTGTSAESASSRPTSTTLGTQSSACSEEEIAHPHHTIERSTVQLNTSNSTDYTSDQTSETPKDTQSSSKNRRTSSTTKSGPASSKRLSAVGSISSATQYSEVEPASKSEIWGWISYDFANSPYSNVLISAFAPLVIDDLAFASGTTVASDGQTYTCSDYKNITNGTDFRCVVPWSGIEGVGPTVESASYSLITISLSVLVQLFLFLSIGSFADYGGYRKALLLGFAFGGAGLTTLYFTVLIPGYSVYVWAAALTIITNVFFGTANIFYNAYLPIIARAHPEVLALTKAGAPEKEVLDQIDTVTNRLSTRGFAFGYTSGVGMLLLCAGIVIALDATSVVGLIISCGLVGVWWGSMTIWFALKVKTRPGPPLPKGENYLIFSWRRMFAATKRAAKLRNTFLMLVAYFVYSDAFLTVTSVGILFARRVVGLGNVKVVIIAIIVPFSALIGSFVWYGIQKLTKAKSKTMLLWLIVAMMMVPLYGILGFIPGITIGLQQEIEMFIYAVYFGLHLGAIQSYSRVLYSELVPEGYESEFFAVYEITDKGSSWIGPLVIAALNDAIPYVPGTGTANNIGMRYGFIYLTFVFLISIPMVYFIDMDKGKQAAKSFTLEEGVEKMTELKEVSDVKKDINQTGNEQLGSN